MDLRKTENRFGFSFKNRSMQIFDSHSDALPTETACSPQYKLKVTKSNFNCIQCADEECFKTLPK